MPRKTLKVVHDRLQRIELRAPKMRKVISSAKTPMLDAVIDPRAAALQIDLWIHGDAPSPRAKAFPQSAD